MNAYCHVSLIKLQLSVQRKGCVYVPVYVINTLVCARARPSPCLHVARLHHNACHCAHALLLASESEDLLYLSSALGRRKVERWSEDEGVKVVVEEGEGCGGGDVR
jgi:hypothetical protein